MIPLIRLPKTACIVMRTISDLKIENHMVQNQIDLIVWLQHTKKHEDWNDMVLQMLRQGVRLEAVIEQCILDIPHHSTFSWILFWTRVHHISTVIQDEFFTTLMAKKIRDEFINKIKNCQRWDQLQTVIDPDGIFIKHISGKITEGIKQCVH